MILETVRKAFRDNAVMGVYDAFMLLGMDAEADEVKRKVLLVEPQALLPMPAEEVTKRGRKKQEDTSPSS